jgi:hypothetical protein
MVPLLQPFRRKYWLNPVVLQASGIFWNGAFSAFRWQTALPLDIDSVLLFVMLSRRNTALLPADLGEACAVGSFLLFCP